MNPNGLRIGLFIVMISMLLVACGNGILQGGDSSLLGASAAVDGVTVDFSNGHYYAVVTGTYPDACTRISQIDQEISGQQITIALFTDKPEDLMCAQMISPFSVDLLLAPGGLMPGEYVLEVNGVATTFTLGE